MRTVFWNRRRQRVLSRLLLGLLLFRAYVPVGFMPASGAPFLVELCPASGSIPTSMAAAMDMPMDAAMDMPMDAPMDMSMPMLMRMPAQMPAQMPMDSVAHHHHSGDSFDHCPFGSVPGTGPISQPIAFEPPGRIAGALKVGVFTAVPRSLRRDPAHPTRGPPSLA